MIPLSVLTPGEITGIIVAVSALIGSLITIWINTNVKIAKIDTTMKLKIAEIETRIKEIDLKNQDILSHFIAENKDEHREIMHDIKGIQKTINDINIKIAQIK